MGVCQGNATCKGEYHRRWKAKRPLWTTYQGVRNRCVRPNSVNYGNYGGRGIKMHEPWLESYDLFESWILQNLGPKPEGKSLDRIDNDSHYEPGNLKWSTATEQWHNSRHTPSALNRLRQQIRDLGAEPCC